MMIRHFIPAITFLSMTMGGMAQSLIPIVNTNSNSPDQKWGYSDSLQTRTVIPYQFDRAFEFKNGLARVVQNGLTGYINNLGKMVIPASFESGTDFSNGFAFVKKAGECFYINKSGINEFKTSFSCPSYPDVNKLSESARKMLNTELEKQFANMSFFDGMALYADTVLKRFGYVDSKGNKILPARYVFATKFTEGVAFVREILGGNVKVINKKGEALFELPAGMFPKDDGFVNGFAVVSSLPQGRNLDIYNYVDKKGTLLLGKPVRKAENFNAGFAVISNGDNERVLINSKGLPAFTEWYHYLGPSPLKGIYYYNRKEGNGYGLIDTLGKIRTPVGYNYFIKISDSVLLCKRWGTSIYTLLSANSGDMLDEFPFTNYLWKLHGKNAYLKLLGTNILGDVITLEYDPMTGKFYQNDKLLTTDKNEYLAKKVLKGSPDIFKYENNYFLIRFAEGMELYKDSADKKVYRNSTFFLSIDKSAFSGDAENYIENALQNFRSSQKYETVDLFKVSGATGTLQYIKAVGKSIPGKQTPVFYFLPISRMLADPGAGKIFVIYGNYFLADQAIEGERLSAIFNSLRFK